MTTNHFAQSVTGTISNLRRLPNSASANPRWEVTIRDADGDETTHTTSSDVSLAYGLDSRDDLRNTLTEFGLTRAGRLNGYTKR